MTVTFAIFCMGLMVGWVSMLLFICLTGNMRTRDEQTAYLRAAAERKEA